MCTVLLPPGVNPFVVDKYINLSSVESTEKGRTGRRLSGSIKSKCEDRGLESVAWFHLKQCRKKRRKFLSMIMDFFLQICHLVCERKLSPQQGLSSYLLVLTYLLIPWSRVHLEKLIGFQPVQKFPAFYGTISFITAFTSARQLSLS